MARKRGTYSLSANIEMLAGAPIDARSVVATKADLTANGSFPYPYIGMETYVVSENKKYKLIADDTTEPASWQELNTVSGLSDTSISSIADGNAIEYDATAQKWKNVPKKAADSFPKYNYSISDHGILTIAPAGETDTLSEGLEKLRSITSQAITDHKNWISGTLPPAPPYDYTYEITDHDLLVMQAAPATDTVTDWVGKIHTALTGIISDHKTWIGSFLPLSGGTMTGQITLSSSGYTVNNEAGYSVNQYGNFNHKRSNTSDYWTIASYDSGTMLRYYYDTGLLQVDKLKLNKSSNQLLTGTGTAGQDKGSGQTNRYVPSVWTFNKAITPADGDEIMIKIPAAGISYGVWLSVDNGTTYYPVGRNDTSRLQTQFVNGTTIHLVFQTNANMTIYDRTGSDSSSTYTGNYWKVVNYYDTNDNTVPSAYCTTAAGTAAKTASCTNYKLLSKSHLQVIIANANTSQTALTLNVNSTGAKAIYINGTASSSSNYTLPAGTYFVYYNGTNFYFRTDGMITADITGTASQNLPLAGGTMTDTIITPADVSKGIRPATSNYGEVGDASYYYYRSYFTNVFCQKLIPKDSSAVIGYSDSPFWMGYVSSVSPNSGYAIINKEYLESYTKSFFGGTNGNVRIWATGNEGESNTVRFTMPYTSYRFLTGLLITRYGVACLTFGFGASYDTGFISISRIFGGTANETFTGTVYSASSTRGIFQVKSTATWNEFALIAYGGANCSDAYISNITRLKT